MSKWDEERIAELMKKRVKMGQTPPAPRPSLAAQELTDAWSEARAIDLTKNRDAASMVRVGDLMASALRQQPPPTPASGETPRTDALRKALGSDPIADVIWDHARQLERELRNLQMAMPDYNQCCELREKAERELAAARSATDAQDAKRYRWLTSLWPLDITILVQGFHAGPTSSEVHDAIDAAMASTDESSKT